MDLFLMNWVCSGAVVVIYAAYSVILSQEGCYEIKIFRVLLDGGGSDHRGSCWG